MTHKRHPCFRFNGLPKKAHPSPEEAEAHRAEVFERFAYKGHVYKCPVCPNWHIGQLPKRRPSGLSPHYDLALMMELGERAFATLKYTDTEDSIRKRFLTVRRKAWQMGNYQWGRD